ncbi:MAG: hypothetical protein Q9210_005817 [Variospora velana]
MSANADRTLVTEPANTTGATTPDVRFEVSDSPLPLLNVSLSASQNLYTRRGTLVGVGGKAENTDQPIGWPLGNRFWHGRVKRYPLSRQSIPRWWDSTAQGSNSKADIIKSLAHWGNTSITGRGLLALAGRGSIAQVVLDSEESYIAHPSNVVAYSMNRHPPQPYRLKSTSFRLQIPNFSLSGILPDTKFFRVISDSSTWKSIRRIYHGVRTWFRRSIWGDRLFLEFHGPATILLQTRAERLKDVLTSRDVDEIAEAPMGAVRKSLSIKADIASEALEQQEGTSPSMKTRPTQMSTARRRRAFEPPITSAQGLNRNIVNKPNPRATKRLAPASTIMGGIRVVARIRPQQSIELERDCIVSAASTAGDSSSQPTLIRIPSFKNEHEIYSFQFSSVYDQASTQQTIFDNEISPTIKHLFNGFDVTIFAYGVTGTGKTHTMRGGKTLAERGIIPRLLSSTYRRCRKIEKDSGGATVVGITLSYYEIYNDKVFDLLEAPEKRTPTGLQLRDNGGKTVVVGLTERPCESLKEFEKLYDQANVNRSTSATKLNAHSSRSHAVLCFKVTMTTGDEVRVSTASAIDLAGSEDNRRTDNGKERMVESASINKSLFVLAKCVEAISQNQTRIPYRESKMTRILSLGQNNGLTVMILNLAPCRSYHLDTISSLNFANRTKKIEIREIENEPMAKGCSRPVPSSAGFSMQRQPLRALTPAVHNTAVGTQLASQKGDKPAKSFSVYSDRSRISGVPANAIRETSKRSSPLKRPSDAGAPSFSRPAKRRSPDRTQRPPAAMSKAVIEDMIEKKVTDLLAARALDHTSAAPVPEISEEVQRRLELLEQKIEGQDDGREQGLTFLLMAKQHSVRGEDKSALRMFLLAKEYFPDNAKLEMKITKLQMKLKEKQVAVEGDIDINISSGTSGQPGEKVDKWTTSLPKEEAGRGGRSVVDDDYRDAKNINEAECDSDDSFRYRPRSKKATKKLVPSSMMHGELGDDPDTPRTKRLLDIVNSQDIKRLRLLRGVGAKKAEAIIEALCGGDDGEGGGPVVVHSLAQLGHLRGVGAKTVENMRAGLEGL